MNLMNFISNLAMPMVILIIILYGISEKAKVFDRFLDGAKEGIEITLNMKVNLRRIDMFTMLSFPIDDTMSLQLFRSSLIVFIIHHHLVVLSI